MKHENATQNLPIAAVLLCTNVKNETELLMHFITVETISVPLKRRLLCRVKERMINPPKSVMSGPPLIRKRLGHIYDPFICRKLSNISILMLKRNFSERVRERMFKQETDMNKSTMYGDPNISKSLQ